MKTELPEHLAGEEARGLILGEPIAQYEVGTGRNFNYLILDWSTAHGSRKAAIVDPQQDLDSILSDLQQHGFELESILLTHTHYDHIAGVGRLLAQNPDLVIRVGDADLHRLPESVKQAKGLKVLSDQETFSVGKLRLVAHHTPGHSAGEFCFYLSQDLNSVLDRPYLFTGDLIFIHDCGRTDFPDGSDAQMFQSIQKVKTLPHATVLLVGHHYAKECATTLGRELLESPPFLCQSLDEFAKL